LRLTHRALIKDTVRAVVLQPEADAQTVLDAALPAELPDPERQALRALILDELRRLHEGVLARYGLRPSQLQAWKAAQGV
ncbi:MAG: Fic family protein, partial [Comamonas sp.]|nr:Fic family protein [Candidatus Comamonas equi]